MFSRFFINRPIFAAVISIVIIIAGLVTLRSLPVAQYPEIAPPTISVSTNYPGANAQVLSETVAQPIEEQVNGVEGMIYMSSTCANNGDYSLTVSFDIGTDLDMAQVLVQNRVSQATALLPEAVQSMGVTTQKQSTNILLFATLTSPNNTFEPLYLSNYATLRIKDELSRIDGVGSVSVFGAGDYSMRIWLNPNKLKARGLTTTDVLNAINEQNVQVAAGQIGQPPAPQDQDFQYSITVKGRLTDVKQFESIIVKTLPGGAMVRLRDIARVELGAQTYDLASQANGIPTAAIAVYQQPGANALDVAKEVKARLEELKQSFPNDLEYSIPFDTTEFVNASIDEVVETIFIAIVLVFIVILVFLQDWRATLIPAATIPVSLIGTFAVMAGLGVSINMLSLFGIVLVIGIVVDDAIVVVENATRNMDDLRLPPKEATIRAMNEVTGPIIATTLVLLAVFVPTAFLGGITGALYRQFALTIATATVFSALNALTLSPALCAIILRPTSTHHNIFARAFNWTFDRFQKGYGAMVSTMVRRGFLVMILFAGLTGAAAWGFLQLPTGFVPSEDQGYAMVSVQLPDAASQKRTLGVIETLNKKIAQLPGVRSWISVPGYSLLDGAVASNAATIWVVFDSWDERLPKGLDVKAMIGQLWQIAGTIQEASVFAFSPPAIMGLGQAGGFEMKIQDKGDVGLTALQQMTQDIALAANGQSTLSQVYSTFRANTPQLFTDVDRTQTKSLGIPLSDVFNTLQANLGSKYVNDFNIFGRSYQVRLQADARFRTKVEDIKKLEVRNKDGDMIPLGTVVSVHKTLGPQLITRYNMYPTATLNGQGAPGVSSGQAMTMMENIAQAKLPTSMGYAWSGMSYQEKVAGSATMVIFALAIIFVYLVLCAQYESWTLPLTIILSVPLALIGTVIAVYIRNMDVNVYTQIGIVLLIALACKTAILISEFAKEGHESGQGIVEAALEAARLRFRPILMTAFAFILGVFPLVIATGAGAASRQALGTAVFAGMISATFLMIFFVPVFYVVIQGMSERFWKRKHVPIMQHNKPSHDVDEL
ncbi:efflux RND transporter permease subunit [Desulfoplanes formicivorans]|uniref:Transporter n=1 Tax=Desulfoplanes formicivorans TaxID=1592317 RepID=A0A194AJ24_9BACT|nr:multidrug efflux RND transporter permease subunit [Desulfoplanes formicivorans]GAU08744.1 transporter [Desulfoplanes formicivorans]